MNYMIRRVEIPLDSAKTVEFEADTLCKIIRCRPTGGWFAPDVEKWRKKELAYDNIRKALWVTIMERWGSVRTHKKMHKIVLLRENEPFELLVPYEPILSRRGSFELDGDEYFVFQY